MRKDVECTFGIMKGRFRILKSGIRLGGFEAADKVFLTCCALHNWLLTIDGLDKQWENGVTSDWEGAIGEIANNDDNDNDETPADVVDNTATTTVFDRTSMGLGEEREELPNAIQRLQNPVARRDGMADESMEVNEEEHHLSTTLATLVLPRLVLFKL